MLSSNVELCCGIKIWSLPVDVTMGYCVTVSLKCEWDVCVGRKTRAEEKEERREM